MLLLIMHTVLAGCMPSNIRIRTTDKQFVAPKKMNLVAGLKEIKDSRPESEKEKNQYYEKPSQVTVSDNLYKNLKLSGIFQDVLLGKFEDSDVDVILEANVDHFFYESGANGWTPVMLLLSITGLPGLIYLFAGGPGGEHHAEASLGIKMTTVDGNVLASGSGENKLTINSNIHNAKSDGIGILEGRALSDATHDAISSLYTNIDLDKLPKSKIVKADICGSDKDCKGVRICVSGMCVYP